MSYDMRRHGMLTMIKITLVIDGRRDARVGEE